MLLFQVEEEPEEEEAPAESTAGDAENDDVEEITDEDKVRLYHVLLSVTNKSQELD